MVSDSQGNRVWQANYSPFGQASIATGSTLTFNLRFPGQYFDAETGLHYNYYRVYDPATGRYIQSDPIGLAGGLNTYGYVGGNPDNHTDSSGLAIDFFVDIGFIGYDTYRLIKDNILNDCDNLNENLAALGANVIGR